MALSLNFLWVFFIINFNVKTYLHERRVKLLYEVLFPRRRNGFLCSQQISFLIEGDVSFCARERPLCAADVCITNNVLITFSCCSFEQQKTHTQTNYNVLFSLHICLTVILNLLPYMNI